MKLSYAVFALLLAAVLGVGVFLLVGTVEVPNSASADFGGVSLRIEYATTKAGQELGLSGREEIPSDFGMLFVFSDEGKHGFWMKDMLVPIDIFWLDDKGQVVHVHESVATSTYPNVFYPPVPVRYVLETASGFARDHGIMLGTPLLLKNPDRVFK